MLFPNGEFSLGLSMSVKPHKPPESSSKRERSGKPQTTYSKKMVRNCVAYLERTHGKHNLAFATYTVPELPEADMVHLRTNWGEVCKQLMQMIGRDQERAGIKPEYVYVVEPQKERYEKTGVIVPHIHAVFQSRKNRYSPYAISKERNTQLWNRALSNVLGREILAPYGAQIDKVKKSAERYMSKYMSKGADIAQNLIDDGHRNALPKQWWGASYSLRNWVKDNCKLLAESTKDYIRQNWRAIQDNLEQSPFSWFYVHCIQLMEPHGEETKIPIAIVGKVKPDWMSAMETRTLDDAVMSWEW
jgi:hypothetical protein